MKREVYVGHRINRKMDPEIISLEMEVDELKREVLGIKKSMAQFFRQNELWRRSCNRKLKVLDK